MLSPRFALTATSGSTESAQAQDSGCKRLAMTSVSDPPQRDQGAEQWRGHCGAQGEGSGWEGRACADAEVAPRSARRGPASRVSSPASRARARCSRSALHAQDPGPRTQDCAGGAQGFRCRGSNHSREEEQRPAPRADAVGAPGTPSARDLRSSQSGDSLVTGSRPSDAPGTPPVRLSRRCSQSGAVHSTAGWCRWIRVCP